MILVNEKNQLPTIPILITIEIRSIKNYRL